MPLFMSGLSYKLPYKMRSAAESFDPAAIMKKFITCNTPVLSTS